MINAYRFQEISNEVSSAINDSFEIIKENSIEYYTLLLAKGDYIGALAMNPSLSPYVIEYTPDKYSDKTRHDFIISFLNKHYQIISQDSVIQNDQYRTHLELMIYTHCWESTLILKELYHISKCIIGEDYNWKISIPSHGKSKFINEHISTPLAQKKVKLSNVIKSTYNSSLRNAFAHSSYTIDDNKIELLHSEKKAWNIEQLSLDEWSERFVYTAFLSLYLYKIIQIRKENFVENTGIDEITIRRPNKSGNGFNYPTIKYEKKEYQGRYFGEFTWKQ